MAAAIFNIMIEQGATFARTLTVYATETEKLNLTGKTVRGQLRRRLTDETAAATFTFQIADQNTNAGEVVWSLTATQTAALAAQVHRYDIELVDGATVVRLLEGDAFVSGEATR